MATAVIFTAGSSQGAVIAGDLVLFFQKTGDTDTVYVNLGSAALLYRGAESGPSAANQALNIININSTLVSAFGADWATDTGIFAGLSAVRSNSTSSTVVNGDQNRTLYASRERASVGTLGLAGSSAIDLVSVGALTNTATSILGLQTNFATQLGTADQGIVSTTLSSIDNAVPITPLGVQQTAFTSISSGVSQAGSATPFGDFGAAGQVEFALDLYRIVPDGTLNTNEIAGTDHIGTYEGTVTIGTNGSVSFITVPEPSSVTLAGLAGLALAFRRRRNA